MNFVIEVGKRSNENESSENLNIKLCFNSDIFNPPTCQKTMTQKYFYGRII